MIGIQVKNCVHHPRLPRLWLFAIQFVKEIACLTQLRFFRQSLFTVRDAVTVGNQCHHSCDQSDRFANVRIVGIVTDVFVERAQHRDAGAQRVHRVRRLRQKPQQFDHFLWQLALSGDLFLEFLQLLAVGQFAVQQQISDFLERGLVAHLVNVIAAVHQPGVRIDPANGRFACNHAGEPGTVFWFGFSGHCLSLTLTTIRSSTNDQSRKPDHSSAAGS